MIIAQPFALSRRLSNDLPALEILALHPVGVLRSYRLELLRIGALPPARSAHFVWAYHQPETAQMIPDRYLAKWAEKQADYMAECRRRAWMREHMPELIDEENDW